MKNSLSTIIKTSIFSAGLALATSALTILPAEAFNLTFSDAINSTESTGSSAWANFEFFQNTTDSNKVDLHLTIKNTTDIGVQYSSLVGIGWQNPDGSYDTALDSNDSPFTQLYDPAKLQPYGTFDLGLRTTSTGGTFAGGQSADGLAIGEEATVIVTYSLDDGSALDVNYLEQMFKDLYSTVDSQGKLSTGEYAAVARFQSVGANQADSDKVIGGNYSDAYQDPNPPEEPVEIPEPGAMMALGSVTFGLLKLRRNK